MTASRATRTAAPFADPTEVFTSIWHAARAFKLALRPELEREQLTIPMFWTLHELANDGAMSVGALASACVVTPANISVAAEELVLAGLAERSTSSKDRRVALLTATTKGRALHRRIWTRAAVRFSIPLRGLPRSDVQSAARVFEHLALAANETARREP